MSWDNCDWINWGYSFLSEHTNRSSPIDQTYKCTFFVWISLRAQLNGLLLNAEIVWNHFVINIQNEGWGFPVHIPPHMCVYIHTHTFTVNSELLWFNGSFRCPWTSVWWAAVNKNILHVGRGLSLCGLCLLHNSSYLNPKQKLINTMLERMYSHTSFVSRSFIQRNN